MGRELFRHHSEFRYESRDGFFSKLTLFAFFTIFFAYFASKILPAILNGSETGTGELVSAERFGDFLIGGL